MRHIRVLICQVDDGTPDLIIRQAEEAALAALRTLLLNGGWNQYWQQRQVLPLRAC